jgi:hypothetical protein
MRPVLLILVHRLGRVHKGPKRKRPWWRVILNPRVLTVLTAILAFLTALIGFMVSGV